MAGFKLDEAKFNRAVYARPMETSCLASAPAGGVWRPPTQSTTLVDLKWSGAAIGVFALVLIAFGLIIWSLVRLF